MSFDTVFGEVFGEPQPFNPISISSLVLWLDSNFGTVLLGSQVTQWTDRANDLDFAQGTSGNRPTYNATSFGDHPSIIFDGADDFLTGPSSAPVLNLTDSFTAYCVMNLTDTSTQRHIFSRDFNNGYRWRISDQDKSQLVINDGNGVQAPVSTTAPSMATNMILSTIYPGGNPVEFREDGVSLGVVAANTLDGIESNTMAMLIGATNLGSETEFLNAKVRHILLFNEVLTVSQQNDVGNFLAGSFSGGSWTNVT